MIFYFNDFLYMRLIRSTTNSFVFRISFDCGSHLPPSSRRGDYNSNRPNGSSDKRDGAPWVDFRDRPGTNFRGRQDGGGRGGVSGRGGPGDGPSGGAGAGGAGADTDRDGWSRGGSSVSLIPPFLQKLFMSLPRHTGPQPDANGLLQALRDRALPQKPRYGDEFC